MTSEFISSMDLMSSSSSQVLPSNLVLGENGQAEHVDTSSALLDLFFVLVRDLSEGALQEQMSVILILIRTTENDMVKSQLLADLFVLAFQTRDRDGGKGEKKLFYLILLELYNEYPDTVIAILELIPTYGYFKDFLNLLELIELAYKKNLCSSSVVSLQSLQSAMIGMYVKQLKDDEKELEASKITGTLPKLTFAGKYAPRQDSKFNSIYLQLVKKLFGKGHSAKKEYRNLVVKLTAATNVPETFMCANRWDELDFKNVPSLCLNRFRKAFLNEKVVKKGQQGQPLQPEEEETGNRHPADPKRIACRKHLEEATAGGKLNGKALQPHELVSKLMGQSRISSAESAVFDGQWTEVKTSALEGIAKFASSETTSPALGAVNLGNVVAMVDVSGSMAGTPMEVAIALGILVSEVSDPAFRDRFITFEERPRWVNLSGHTSLHAKVQATQSASWGCSTNFEAAFEMILKGVIENKLDPTQIPDLIVFSDMQFDQAGRFGETMMDVMTRRFAEAGVQICGQPYRLPKIVFWNLRGDTGGFPARANTPNTQMLSGFSASLLKLLLAGEPVESVVEEVLADGTVVVTRKEVTPEETLRKCLDDPRYDPVRQILSKATEGVFAKYSFTPAPTPVVETVETVETLETV